MDKIRYISLILIMFLALTAKAQSNSGEMNCKVTVNSSQI